MKTLLYTICFALCMFVVAQAHAQLDPSFGNGGKVIMPIDPLYSNAEFNAVSVCPNGKILAAGGGYGGRLMARYNDNGMVDTSFAGNGVAIDSFGGNGISCLAIQPDGKIISIGGYLERFLPNGGRDSGFGINSRVTLDFYNQTSLALQNDQKIVIAGVTQNEIYIQRFNSLGSIDSSFGVNGTVYTNFNGGGSNDVAISSILIQPDGKIVVSGDSKVPAISAYAFIALRYNTDGSLDTSFNHTGKVYTNVGGGWAVFGRDLKLQPDGKLLQCGAGGLGIALVRYNTDGSLDTSFDHTGIYSIDGDLHEAHRMALTSSGSIIITGVTDTNQCSIRRIYYNGGIDSSFGTNGRILSSLDNIYECRVVSLHLYSDERILVGGHVSAAAFLMRFLPNGNTTGVTIPLKTNGGSLQVYPNPANESVTIVPPVGGQLLISDNNERITVRKTVNSQPLQLDISGFIPGLYFITIKTFTGQILRARFLKK